jgi:hypothetical protein
MYLLSFARYIYMDKTGIVCTTFVTVFIASISIRKWIYLFIPSIIKYVLLLQVLKEPQFTYIVDMDVRKILDIEPRAWDFIARLEPKLGAVEYMPGEKSAADLVSMLNVNNKGSNNVLGIRDTHSDMIYHQQKKPRVAVIGSGPSGLFASLVLGELGAEVTLLERGQPVEQRGRDIGALAVRRILQSESNFCFGEVF